MGNPILYIVIPCYNEEAGLPLTSGMFLKKIKDLAAAGKISDKSRIPVSYTHLDVYKRQSI